MSRTFTADEDRIILAGRAAGLPWNAIGKQIGTTGKACQYRLSRGIGVPDPKVVQASRRKSRRGYEGPGKSTRREALPPGVSATWQAITVGTVLEGRAFG